MSRIIIEVAAGRDVLKSLREANPAIRRGIRQGWFEVGRDWKSEANTEILRKPKSGRVYIVRSASGRRRRHVASAPGETHANLTGALRKALSWKVRGSGEELDVGYGVSSSVQNAAPDYDAFVEFGTRRMAPRPSVGNAVNSVQRNAEQSLAEAVSRELVL